MKLLPYARFAILAAYSLINVPVLSQPTSTPQILWTDRGINNHDNGNPVVSGSSLTVVRMPSDKEMADPRSTWRDSVAIQILEHVGKSKANGNPIEILTAQNMSTGGYMTDGQRQKQIEAWMGVVAEAIFEAKTQTAATVTGVFASNGGNAFANISLGLSGRNSNPVDKAIFVNSRSSVDSTSNACHALKACVIVVSKGDHPSSEMGMGDAFRRIGNRKYAIEVYESNPQSVQVFDLDGKGFQFPWRWPDVSSHAWLMNKDFPLSWRRYEGSGRWSDWTPGTGHERLEAWLEPNNSRRTAPSSRKEQLQAERKVLFERMDALSERSKQNMTSWLSCSDRCRNLKEGMTRCNLSCNDVHEPIGKSLSNDQDQLMQQVYRIDRELRSLP